MTMSVDQFQPTTLPAPDWSAAANWSGGVVPGAGTSAAVVGVAAMIDPGVTIEANIALNSAGSADGMLVGNYGAVVLGASATLSIGGDAALYASDSVVNQGVVAVAAGSVLDVVVDLGAVSGMTGAPAPSFGNEGVIDLSVGATLTIGDTEFENSGVVGLVGSTLDIAGGAAGGLGSIDLSQGALAWFGDGVADQSFSFGGGGGTLALADPLLGAGVDLSGFGAGDMVLLPSLAGAQVAQAGGVVTILDAAGVVEGSFALGGGVQVGVIGFGSGSAIVAEATPPVTPCYARGTRILTPLGYRAVESLVAGDTVVTEGGVVRKVVWVGSRTLDLAGHPAPETVRPIRIDVGALAEGVPLRALRLSPDHAVLVEGVLIPAKLLVNGATIVREDDCLAVTYHHVELARHDVLLAEGAPCESYLDTGNRGGFAGARAWPVRVRRWDRDACAPLCVGGVRLAAARAGLHERALELGFVVRPAGGVSVWVDGVRVAERGAGERKPARFALPKLHGGRAVIRSARFVPAWFDPGSEDRRELGVAVGGVRVGRRRFRPEALAVGGFHSRGAGDRSLWTDGAGVIGLPVGVRAVGLEVAGLPLGWLREGWG